MLDESAKVDRIHAESQRANQQWRIARGTFATVRLVSLPAGESKNKKPLGLLWHHMLLIPVLGR